MADIGSMVPDSSEVEQDVVEPEKYHFAGLAERGDCFDRFPYSSVDNKEKQVPD